MAHEEARNQFLEEKLQSLKKDYPQWFNYNDTLGERPIDGFVRQLDKQKLDNMLNEDRQRTQQNPKVGI